MWKNFPLHMVTAKYDLKASNNEGDIQGRPQCKGGSGSEETEVKQISFILLQDTITSTKLLYFWSVPLAVHANF